MRTIKGLMVLMMLILASVMTIGVASADDGKLVGANQVQSSTAWTYYVSGYSNNMNNPLAAVSRAAASNRWFGGAQCTARASWWRTQYVTCSAW